jgi:hypothetical protein
MTTSPAHESTVETAQLLMLERPSAEVISPKVQEQQTLQPDVARVDHHADVLAYSFIPRLVANHDLHHRQGSEKNFGVSSPLWDHVFRSYTRADSPPHNEKNESFKITK